MDSHIQPIDFDHSSQPHEESTVPLGSLFVMDTPTMLPDSILRTEFALIQRAGDASQRKHHHSRARAALDTLRIDPPNPTLAHPAQKRPKLHERDSANSVSTARSSYDTQGTARTSATSVDITDMTQGTLTTVAECTAYRLLPIRKAFLCPKCNSGKGHHPRINSNNKRKAHGAGEDGSRSKFAEYKYHWDNPQPFDKHTLDWHITDFKRCNSSEYICCYCLCTCVSGQSAACTGRFRTAQDMVVHVRTCHAKGPRMLPVYQHWCTPIDIASYVDALGSELARRSGGEQEWI